MRHARARLEIFVVSREAALRLLPVRLWLGGVTTAEDPLCTCTFPGISSLLASREVPPVCTLPPSVNARRLAISAEVPGHSCHGRWRTADGSSPPVATPVTPVPVDPPRDHTDDLGTAEAYGAHSTTRPAAHEKALGSGWLDTRDRPGERTDLLLQ